MQVRTPEGLLKTWRKATRQYPFDFHVGPHRIVHARNVLISGARVDCSLMIPPLIGMCRCASRELNAECMPIKLPDQGLSR